MRGSTRILGIGVLLIGLTLSGSLPLIHGAAAQSLVPAGLSLSPIPPKLPADNNTYPAVVVSVIDAAGQPTVASSDLDVLLTSAQQNVGTVTASVEILAGDTYAIANLTTTHTPGVTTITATTTGLETASTTVTTVIAVGYPTQLVITAVPATVPASVASTGTLILELEDDVGLPAKAIANVPISLYSSNTDLVNITSATTVMDQGEYLKEINYTSGFVPGSALVTASAPGFDSGMATITILGSPPLALKLQAQPSLMVACSSGVTSCTGRLVVALTDLSGNPTRAPRDIEIQIRSSDLGVVNASETTTIEEGNISAIATYAVTATSVSTNGGQAIITASSPGLQSSFATVLVENPAPLTPSSCTSGDLTLCQLAIYAGPNPVLADHRSYSSVVVSLQNPGGTPAINNTGPTEITLTSSVTGVGNFTKITFPIPEGQNWAAVTFTTTYQVGVTELTASAQNVLSIQTQLDTYGAVPSRVVLRAISTTLPADGASHPALQLSLEDALGDPAIAASAVPVSLSSSQSDVVGVADTVIPIGQTFAIVNVTAGILQGTANVTALVSSFTSGYAASSVDISTVIPAPSAVAAIAPDSSIIMLSSAASSRLSLVAVQLQNSEGIPARASIPMILTITSSNSSVISKVTTAVIQVGQDYALLPLAVKSPGTTTLTISAPGLTSASIPITFLAYPNVETLTGGPTTILLNQTSVMSVNVALDGIAVQGVHVDWRSANGELVIATPPPSTASASSASSSSETASPVGVAVNDTTDAAGASTVVFHPTTIGPVLITAVIAPGGLLTRNLNFTVQVTANPVAIKIRHTLAQELFPLILVPIGAVGGGVAAVLFIRRRSGPGTGGQDQFDESFE